MAGTDKRRMTIYYTSGDKQVFEFPKQTDQKALIAGAIKELMDSKALMIELEDRTLVIPFSSIRSVEISPSPEKLPLTAIKGARLVK